jgi:hypothetical protein
MRKTLLAAFAALAVVAGVSTAAHAQSYNGPGWMHGGYGPGYGMMGGYGPGWMHGGYGYGMMGGRYGDEDRGYRRGRGYRGERLCWKDTDSARGFGYYAQCEK